MANRSSSATVVPSGTSIAVARPSPVPQAGDLLFCYLLTDIGLNGPAPTWTTVPAGWALITGSNQGANSGAPDGWTSWVYKKIATGTEAATETFTHNGAATQIIALVACQSGRNRNAVFDASNTHGTVNTTGNATPVTVSDTGITALSTDDIIVFANGDITVGTDTWAFTPPTNYTERQDSQTTFNVATLATRDEVFSGATGTLSLTLTRSAGTGTSGWGIFVIAVPVTPVLNNVKPLWMFNRRFAANKSQPWTRSPVMSDAPATAPNNTLIASADGSSFLDSTLLATGALISNADGRSQTTEVLTGVAELTGKVSGVSQHVSNISAGIKGNSFGSSQAQGTLLGSAALLGNINNSVSSVGNLSATGLLIARVDTYGTARGLVQGISAITGNTSGNSFTQSTLLGAGQLTARVAGTEFSIQNLQGIAQIVGNVAGSSQARATAIGGFFMFGNSSGQGEARLLLIGTGQLTGRVHGNEFGSQSLQGVAPLISNVYGSSTPKGVLTGSSFITGVSNGQGQSTLFVTGNGELKGNIFGSQSSTGNISTNAVEVNIYGNCQGYSFSRGVIISPPEIAIINLYSPIVKTISLASEIALKIGLNSHVQKKMNLKSQITTKINL